MKYFETTQQGRSVWWSWIFATWIAIVIWTLGQSILIQLMTTIAGDMDPTLKSEFAEAAVNMADMGELETYTALFGTASLIAIASVMGVVATVWLSNKYLAQKAHLDAFGGGDFKDRNNAILALSLLTTLAIIISASIFVMAGRLLDGTYYMALMQRAMGLSPLTYSLFLLTFPVGCLGLYLMQKVIHQRSVMSLHNALSKIRWGWIFEGFVLSWLVIGTFMFLGSKLGLFEIRLNFNAQVFFSFALASLIFIPLQAGTEEIVFRGYFNQALTHLTRNKWVAFILTSIAFMAMHLSNPEALEGAAAGTLPIVMSGYFFFGFAMCLLVWLDDGIETAIGVHAGNNCFAAIVVNYEGSVLPTPSMFMAVPDAVSDAMSTIIILAVIVAIIWWRRGGPSRSDDRPSIADA
ncbi:CPBP family intramembrane glutamic endopeptidase [Litorimonas sp. WD9-15]|uniref:CPBP family intramembrane glutamic endopeptidase n=1 Tax=Litorimonas sp. WD9-15 TaxID=3418716 RepID=UPI003D054FF7